MRRRPPGRSVAQQGFALRGRFPDGRVVARAGRLVWTGRLTPTPLSRGYIVRIDYAAGGPPRVRVLDPQLDGRQGEPLPHVYSDGTLCLHRAGEWTATMSIADSIVPWTAEWLAFYEIWQATGDWQGGGEWPPVESLGSRASGSRSQFVARGAPAAEQEEAARLANEGCIDRR